MAPPRLGAPHRFAVVLSLVLSGSARPAFADEHVRLELSRSAGTEACPDEPALRAAVTERLGVDPFDARAERALVLSMRRAHDGRPEAELVLLDPSGVIRGRRVIRSPTRSCQALARAVTLAIIVALESIPGPPVATRVVLRDDPPGRRATPRPPERTRAPPRPRTTAHSASRPLSVRFHTALAVSSGTAPGSTWGVAFGARIVVGSVRLGLEGRADAPSSKASPEGGRVEGRLVSLTSSSCYAPDLSATRALALEICALSSVGALMTRGLGVDHPRDDLGARVAFGARLAVLIRVRDAWWMAARADGLGFPWHTRLQLQHRDVWVSPTAAGTVSLGLEVEL